MSKILATTQKALSLTSIGRYLAGVCFSVVALVPAGVLAESNSTIPRNVQFSSLQTEFGFSSEFVHDIAQDQLGFMWFATQSGLNRFDGHEVEVFETFSNDLNSISHSFVWDIHISMDGSVWLGTEKGVNRYSYKENRFVREPFTGLSLADYRVRQITQDAQGIFWVGTLGDGLLRVDPSTNSLIQFETDVNDLGSIPNNHVMSLLIDQRGELWVGTDGGGLARFDSSNSRFVRYESVPDNEQTLSDNRIRRIHEDSRGQLWIGTASGGLNLFESDVGRFTRFSHDPDVAFSLPAGQVSAIFEDEFGTLWVGTESGLAEYRPSISSFITYRYDAGDSGSLVNDRINVITQDASGVLWVGTHGGISRWNYFSDTFTYFRSRDGYLSSDSVSALAETSQGILWVGTYGGGLSRIDPKSGEVAQFRAEEGVKDSLPDDRVMVVYVDDDDRVWVGTRSAGLARKNLIGSGFEHFVHDDSNPKSLSDNAVTSILRDRAGGLWVGTFGGGLNYSKDGSASQFQRMLHDPQDRSSISGNRVLRIFEDRQGFIWVGTEGDGLNRLDVATGSFRQFDLNVSNTENSRPRGTPWEIVESADGHLWIGSLGQGLFHLPVIDNGSDQESRQKLKQYSSAEGLASDIYGILPGSKDKLWLSSNRGLFEFDMQSKEARKFDRNNGLLGNEFNQGARFRSRTGKLLFGSNQGLVSFYPADLPSNDRVPVIAIEMKSRTDSLGRTWTGDSVPEVRLDYFNAYIEFDFVALDFVSPDKNEYRYRLLGLDSEWTIAQNYRQAIYSSLSPGKYTFQVEASNNDGVWNRHKSEVEIYVVPPPWSSWWAYLIYAISIVFVVGLYINAQRNKRLDEAQARLKLEQLVTARTVELADRNADLMSLNEKLEHASVTDALTGLRNRRFVDEHMAAELSKLRRRRFENDPNDDSPGMLFLMMVDLDGFKSINDQFGHQAGDQALLGVKERLLAACRKSDVVVRWGGDEFLIIGHSRNVAGIEQFTEKVRICLSARPYDVGGGNEGELSGSIGVAPIPFIEGNIDFVDWEQICRVADMAAYLAKDSGRDAWVSVLGGSKFTVSDLTDLRENLPGLLESQKIRLKSSRPLTHILT